MSQENKGKIIAAVAGAVVGAGAVIASVIAIKDKRNQKKLKELVTSAKDLLKGSKQSVSDVVEESRKNIKKVAGKTIKSAQKGVKNI